MWLSHHQEYILLESAWDRVAVAITTFCSIVLSTLLILERHEEAKPSYAFDYKVNQVITVSASVCIHWNKQNKRITNCSVLDKSNWWIFIFSNWLIWRRTKNIPDWLNLDFLSLIPKLNEQISDMLKWIQTTWSSNKYNRKWQNQYYHNFVIKSINNPSYFCKSTITA